ncbi:hypothetical protein UlMin_008699 [Ulmus minor]
MDLKVEGVKVEEGPAWGKTLAVPTVKEFARTAWDFIPEKYVQEYNDRPIETVLSPDETSELPIIDFSLLVKGDEAELNKLDYACKEWGFLQLINHGVAEDVLGNMKAATASFFDLPVDEKNKYAMGDSIEGYGNLFVVSEEQKLDWADSLFFITRPEEQRNMKKWPITLPGFKDAVEEYSIGMKRVTEELLAKLSLLLGMEKNSLDKQHVVMRHSMRMIYYPQCPKPELVLGCSPHSDPGSITLLLQSDDVVGLQIKHKGGWVPVTPIPNAFVVNVADALESWSNGLYKSIEHRAVANSKIARMSIGTFIQPADEAKMGPAKSIIQDRPKMYKDDIKYIDYMRNFIGMKLTGKAHTNFLKLENEY